MSILLNISPGLIQRHVTVQHVEPLPYCLFTDPRARSCRKMPPNALL